MRYYNEEHIRRKLDKEYDWEETSEEQLVNSRGERRQKYTDVASKESSLPCPGGQYSRSIP